MQALRLNHAIQIRSLPADRLEDFVNDWMAQRCKDYLYKHLASLKNGAQFIVIENSTPPTAVNGRLARITTFTHTEGNGRFGLLARNSKPSPQT